MGLSYLVFPGARHTRFQHVLGCVYLMQKAVESLRSKNVEISDREAEGLYIAILLHDIGHGPFSHAMEHSIVEGISHEEISLRFMQALNREFKGRLDLAIQIFQGTYPRKFYAPAHLQSIGYGPSRLSQARQFLYGSCRGEHQFRAHHIDAHRSRRRARGGRKRNLLREKFLVARRLMYWQVYLHKTSIAAEQLLIKLLQRAKEIVSEGGTLPMSGALAFFISQRIHKDDFTEEVLERFAALDDTDIIFAMKQWQFHPDAVLSRLSRMLLYRDLPKVKVRSSELDVEKLSRLREKIAAIYGISKAEASYFVFTDRLSNRAYNAEEQPIKILTKNGRVIDVARASDQSNLEALAKPVVKYYVCYPKRKHP